MNLAGNLPHHTCTTIPITWVEGIADQGEGGNESVSTRDQQECDDGVGRDLELGIIS